MKLTIKLRNDFEEKEISLDVENGIIIILTDGFYFDDQPTGYYSDGIPVHNAQHTDNVMQVSKKCWNGLNCGFQAVIRKNGDPIVKRRRFILNTFICNVKEYFEYGFKNPGWSKIYPLNA